MGLAELQNGNLDNSGVFLGQVFFGSLVLRCVWWKSRRRVTWHPASSVRLPFPLPQRRDELSQAKVWRLPRNSKFCPSHWTKSAEKCGGPPCDI